MKKVVCALLLAAFVLPLIAGCRSKTYVKSQSKVTVKSEPKMVP